MKRYKYFVIKYSTDLHCPKGENYWPCQCDRGWFFSVKCKSIPTEQVVEIFKTPNQTVNFFSFNLEATTTLGVVHIPANVLSYRIVSDFLTLKCHRGQNEIELVPLTIDPNAFNSSLGYLKQLNIWNCDLGRLDFSFLTGFNQLRVFKVFNATNIEKANWNLFPPLPSLKELEFQIDRELQNNLNAWALKLPPLTNGIRKLVLFASVHDDEADHLVHWLLKSSVATLQHLELQQTKLTRIPPRISQFENLIDSLIITCDDSEINVLIENSIKLNILPSVIEISQCGIDELQSGAIQGKSSFFKCSLFFYY